MDDTGAGRLRFDSLTLGGVTLMQIRTVIPRDAAKAALKLHQVVSYDGTIQP